MAIDTTVQGNNAKEAFWRNLAANAFMETVFAGVGWVASNTSVGKKISGWVDYQSEVAGSWIGRWWRKAPSKTPHGFADNAQFEAFGKELNDGLAKAEYGEAEAIFRGSSVTGKKFTTGEAFDVGRVSDFDIALADPKLIEKAKSLGIPLRSGGTRTGPLTAADLQKLGLKDLADKLSKQACGREVNFMNFDSAATSTGRSPSIVVPKSP